MTSSFLRWTATAACAGRNFFYNLLDPPVLTLTYHRVSKLQTDPQFLAVTPENFRAQLKFLKKKFPVVRFEDDWSGINRASVAITFDDGYADNVGVALPILEELEVPATFFVSTGAIGVENEFWWDEVERIILRGADFSERFDLRDDRFGTSWDARTVAERRTFYEELLVLMKEVDYCKRDQWLVQLRQWAGAEGDMTEGSLVMTVDELKRLSRSKWTTIGAHTVTHTPLSSLSEAEQRKEIVESKKKLESWLGREVTVFSYPFGQRCDYTSDSVELCRRAGFVKAAANFPGQAHRWTDPYQIPRLVMRNWPPDIFRKHLKRFWIV